MQHKSKPPVCPVCKGKHYPPTNGRGDTVNCDGSLNQEYANRIAKRDRAALRKNLTNLPPLDNIDRARIPSRF